MRRASILVLLGASFLLSGPALAAKPPAKAKPKAVPTTATKTSATGKKTASKSLTTSKMKAGNTRPVKTHLVRTKSGHWTRVAVRTPPGPSFQTHPDPDRYTEIQRALADRGFFKGESNGQWGDDSVEALRRFQAGTSLPDDGKISALTLSGLGLGPRHDGSTASTVPLPTAVEPAVVGNTVGPAASTPAAIPPSTRPPN